MAKVIPLFKDIDIPQTLEDYKSKYNEQKIDIVVEASKDMIENIALSMRGMGFIIEEKDYLFLREVIAASILRMYHIKHPFHVTIDNFFEKLISR